MAASLEFPPLPPHPPLSPPSPPRLAMQQRHHAQNATLRAPGASPAAPATAHVEALEVCIRNFSRLVAASAPRWTDHCLSPAAKTALQTAQVAPLLDGVRVAWGYPSALWCAFWATPMPDEPFHKHWREELLCPWRKYEDAGGALHCPDALRPADQNGVPTHNHLQQSYYHVILHVMPCAVCAALRDRFSEEEAGGRRVDKRYEPLVSKGTPAPASMFHDGTGWPNQWDLHPVGVWLATDATKWGWPPAKVVDVLSKFRLDNGEVMHGYVWGSLQRLPPSADPVQWAIDASAPTWQIDAHGAGERGYGFSGRESNLEFAHASGHGYYYFYQGDLQAAMRACWSARVEAPFRKHATSTDYQQLGKGKDRKWNSKYLWAWRWACSGGAFHSAFNALSAEALHQMAAMGVTDARQYVCQQNAAASAVSKGTGTVHGDKTGFKEGDCPAGLGADEAQGRLQMVKQGMCASHVKPSAGPLAPHRVLVSSPPS
uniref:Uncharacterized protein n=1 Tax=Calcidiscus leptoporus TaxID=127549 RepID=A0A7S0J0J5_9EUKA